MGNKNWWAMVVMVTIFALACSTAAPGSPTPGASATGGATPSGAATASAEPSDEPSDEPSAEPTDEPEPAVPTAPTGFTELDAALTKAYEGSTVNIQTQWIGGEGENFAASIADFVEATGIAIQVDSIGSSHETVLRTRIEGGQPPDLAMLAQPTAVLAYGADGALVDVSTFMGAEGLQDTHTATVGLITDEAGAIWGIPYKADVKSTVWYTKRFFDANNLTPPTTWDEMTALEDALIALDVAPWCMGMEAGTATGWQFTDWVEEVMLRTVTPEQYEAWIAGDLDFTSPEVRAAFERVINMIYKDGNVLGGPPAVMTTAQTTPFDPAFPDGGTSDEWEGFTPGCAMHKIPTWYGPDFFPDVRAGGAGTETMYEIGEDIEIFYLPGINEAQGTPALGSADTLMVLEKDYGDADPNKENAVRAVAQFLSTPQGTQRWIETGSAISANNTTPQEWYADFYKLDVAAEIVNSASYVGFDASDLMPPEVGAGTFWTESVQLVANGPTYLDTALENIENSWPAE